MLRFVLSVGEKIELLRNYINQVKKRLWLKVSKEPVQRRIC